jgi:hypothetical protein
MPLQFEGGIEQTPAERRPTLGKVEPTKARATRARRHRAMAAEPAESLEMAELSAELDKDIRARRSIITLGVLSMLASVVVSTAFFSGVHGYLDVYVHHSTRLVVLGACITFLLPMLTVAATASYMIGGRTKAMRRKVQRLRANRSAGAAGALVDLLAQSEPSVQRSASLALQEILPRWTEDDLAALSQAQRRALRAAVLGRRTRDGSEELEPTSLPVELRVALCHTFARIGGYAELAFLRQAASIPSLATETRTVQREAHQAAVALELRLGAESTPRSLLRASSAPAATADDLLRAATTGAGSPPDELLRSNSNPDTDDSGRSADLPAARL